MSKIKTYTQAQLPRHLTQNLRNSKFATHNKINGIIHTIVNTIVEFTEATMKHIIVLIAVLAVAGCMFGILAPQAAYGNGAAQQSEQPQPSIIRGRVWDDTNHDGIRQATERGYVGITVTLYTGRVQIVTTTLTSATGEYEFTNLESKSYTVGFSLPKDYAFTVPSATQATSATDSNVNANGVTDEIAINAGDEMVNIDAGIWRSALVGEEPPTFETHLVFIPFVSNGR